MKAEKRQRYKWKYEISQVKNQYAMQDKNAELNPTCLCSDCSKLIQKLKECYYFLTNVEETAA